MKLTTLRWWFRHWRRPQPYREPAYHNAYEWHLPRYPYGSVKPVCDTCHTGYPCRVSRAREAARWTS